MNTKENMVIDLMYSLDQIQELVTIITHAMKTCSIITLTGPLGAGKTTLTRELLRAWGVSSIISSPTFTYVNRYENDKGQVFYHFDLYRIANVREFQDAGFDEYLYQPHSWAIIEWPEVIEPLLKNTCAVTLSYYDDSDKRKANIVYGI